MAPALTYRLGFQNANAYYSTARLNGLPKGGTITIRARAEGNMIRLEVEGTGIGMPEDIRARCTEPFFSTKGSNGWLSGRRAPHSVSLMPQCCLRLVLLPRLEAEDVTDEGNPRPPPCHDPKTEQP